MIIMMKMVKILRMVFGKSIKNKIVHNKNIKINMNSCLNLLSLFKKELKMLFLIKKTKGKILNIVYMKKSIMMMKIKWSGMKVGNTD